VSNDLYESEGQTKMENSGSAQAAAPRRRLWLVIAIIAGLCLCAALAVVVVGQLALGFFNIATVTTSTATPGPGEPSGQAPQPAIAVQGRLADLVLPGSAVTAAHQGFAASTASAPYNYCATGNDSYPYYQPWTLERAVRVVFQPAP